MNIDELAYRFWSVHPRDIDEWLKTAPTMPDGYKGGMRAWFYACEMRKIVENSVKGLQDYQPDTLPEVENDGVQFLGWV